MSRIRIGIVVHVLGVLALFVGGGMALTAVLAWLYGGDDTLPIAVAAAVSLAGGTAGVLLFRRVRGADLGIREGFVIVALGWLLACLLGALPYALYPVIGRVGGCVDAGLAGSEFCSWTNSFFESVSGFTTTGASILHHGLWPTTLGPSGEADVAVRATLLPHGILFWRSLTHWYGGMGIIVLSLAILPYLGIGGMQLYRAEVPGPSADKLVPRIADTAKILWGGYIALSAAQAVLLMYPGGLDAFNAVTHTFGTLATGGFSPLSASVGGLQNPLVEVIITVFMFLAGMNFALHFMAVRGHWSSLWRDSELRAYSVVVLGATVLVTIVLLRQPGSDEPAVASVRSAAFHVVSIVTTTGFATSDFSLWAPAGQAILVMLMFLGGCAGSTGGGPKVVRILSMVKVAIREMVRLLHPRAVVKVRLNRRPVEEAVLSGIAGFLVVYTGIFLAGTLFMALEGHDIPTALSAVAATLGNVGPGLGTVGPAAHYDHVSVAGKWVLSLCMLAGRLELFTLLILVSPAFWRR